MNTLYFYDGDAGSSWFPVFGGAANGNGGGASLPATAELEQLLTGSLLQTRMFSPHVIHDGINMLAMDLITENVPGMIAAYGLPFTRTLLDKLNSVQNGAQPNPAEVPWDDIIDYSLQTDSRGTIPGLISPWRLRGAIEHIGRNILPSVISVEDITNWRNEHAGLISGQRFKQALDQFVQLLHPHQIVDPLSDDPGLISGERFKEAFDTHIANFDLDSSGSSDISGEEIVRRIEAEMGDHRLNYNALRNLPVIGSARSGAEIAELINGLEGDARVSYTALKDQLTGANLVALLSALTGDDRLDASKIKNLPTSQGGSITGAGIVQLLSALMGANRLPASAIRDLPSSTLDANGIVSVARRVNRCGTAFL